MIAVLESILCLPRTARDKKGGHASVRTAEVVQRLQALADALVGCVCLLAINPLQIEIKVARAVFQDSLVAASLRWRQCHHLRVKVYDGRVYTIQLLAALFLVVNCLFQTLLCLLQFTRARWISRDRGCQILHECRGYLNQLFFLLNLFLRLDLIPSSAEPAVAFYFHNRFYLGKVPLPAGGDIGISSIACCQHCPGVSIL